jgi:uncharacterized membrane protein (UPF0127 family)
MYMCLNVLDSAKLKACRQRRQQSREPALELAPQALIPYNTARMTAARTAVPLLVVFAAAWGTAGCGSAKRPGLPAARIRVKGVDLQVEVAANDTDRVMGLRFRPHLEEGTGMIFLFPESKYQIFVMDDTVVPLSIAFVKEDGTIAQIEDMEPLARTRTWSIYQVPVALEVPQGWFRENGIVEGDRVEGLDELVKRYPPR